MCGILRKFEPIILSHSINQNMNSRHLIFLFALLFSVGLTAQELIKQPSGYDFQIKENIACTPVKSQDRTGTCWSFSTVSFLESELIRQGKGNFDLSEMYIVRNIYKDKAMNYVLRQGKAQFSQGSLNHDVMRAFKKHGIMPEAAYSGKTDSEVKHDHSELVNGLKGYLDGIMKSKRLSVKWMRGFEAILDAYLGEVPEQFEYAGKETNVKNFSKDLGINPDDYVELTSFSHHPYYTRFVLEIPDNYSNGSYYNVPPAELRAAADHALSNGYSVAWDGDVSEKGFSAREGIAIVPAEPDREDLFKIPGKEEKITAADRQSAFLNYDTTDDHLMHLTGTATDKNGTKYYLTKNSWGEISDYKGFLYMSQAYFDLKTVGIMVHKDGLPANLRKQLAI